MSLRESMGDPRRRRHLALASIALLTWLALLLRLAIDIDGVMDIDAINYGLAALRFDMIQHQPHPPGSPGYVLFLKTIHGVAPGLGPIEIAKWGSRLCGAATVPTAYWACRELLAPRAQTALGRPLAAAALAALHPLLWYYGAEGQSHAAEGLLTVLLFAIAFRVRRTPTRSHLLIMVAAFGLTGSLRPTIPMLSSPLLLWMFWGRPRRDWVLAFAVGVASVAVWAVPLVTMVGGYSMYRRATDAIVSDVFIANYSLWSSRAKPMLVRINLLSALWYSALALVPLLTWWHAAGPEQRWRRAWLSVVLLNIVFYASVYTAEPGYLAAVAGLSCLVPATWPDGPNGLLRARATATFLALPALLLLGPASLPVGPGAPAAVMPSIRHIAEVQQLHHVYGTAVCAATDGKRAIVLTDNPLQTHARHLPLACPNAATAMYIDAMPFDPERRLEIWMIYFSDSMMALPTGIPLEPGPAARARLPAPVEHVVFAPDATPRFVSAMLDQARCPAQTFVAPGSGLELRWLPARCLPVIQTPSARLELSW